AAVGEERVARAAEQRHIGSARAATRAGEQRSGGRDRRGVADRDMAHVADQVGDHGGEQLFVAKRLFVVHGKISPSSWPGIAVRRTASLRSPMSRPSTSWRQERKTWMPGTRPGMTNERVGLRRPPLM